MKLLNTLCELIFPKICAVCSNALHNEDTICLRCTQQLPFYAFNQKGPSVMRNKFWGESAAQNCFSLLDFQQRNITQNILHLIKYNKQQSLALEMGKLIAKHMETGKYPKPDAIIPVPIHPKKKYKRGYNQAEVIAKGMEMYWKTPVIKALKRVKHTQSQTSLSRDKRWKNLNNTFRRQKELSAYNNILLVDDVLTTGATLAHCIAAINHPNCSIATLAISEQ